MLASPVEDPGYRPGVHDEIDSAMFADNGFSVVLFDGRNQQVHTLNPTSSAIWSLIDGASSMEDISIELSEVFSVERHQIANDVIAAINEFWSAGLLEGAPSAKPHGEALAGADLQPLARRPDP